VKEGFTVTLDGSRSIDPDDGIASYFWERTAGPAVNLSDPTEVQPTFTVPVGLEGESLTFQLTTVDKGGLKSVDTCIVNVTSLNLPPTASAGPDQIVDEGSTVTLDGSNSKDLDDGIFSYFWEQLSGTAVTLSDPTAINPTFVTPPVDTKGTALTFQLRVKDTEGLQATANVTVTIKDNGITGFPDDVVTLTSATGENIGMKEDNGGNCTELVSIDPSTLPDTPEKPEKLIYSLIDLKIKVDRPGAKAEITFYLPNPAPLDYRWYKYNSSNGWYDYSANTYFNVARDQVTLVLIDGGAGDDDGVANGIILDPSGLGTGAPSRSSAFLPEVGDNPSCFISTAGYGSSIGPTLMAILLALIIATGIVLLKRRCFAPGTSRPAQFEPQTTAGRPKTVHIFLFITMLFALLVWIGGGVSHARTQGKPASSVDPFYGAFGTDVPIEVPKFRALEPTLKLVYGSAGRNGWVGMGWTLSGSSFIERASPGKGTPRYDSSDIFLLDGMELVEFTELGGTHATKIQNYHRITRDNANNQWYVWRKDGTKGTYTALLNTSKGTFQWALTSLEDTHGNRVNYRYWSDEGQEYYLDTISYNGTTLKFYSEPRPDEISYATGAGLAKIRYRLKTIDVTVNGTRARAYKLSYTTGTSTSQSLLSGVQQFGRDASLDASGTVTGWTALPEMTMIWQGENPASGFDRKTWNSQLNGSWYWNYRGDFNGDGKIDIASYINSSAIRVHLSNGDGFDIQTWSSQLNGHYYWNYLGDFNGDGKTDIASYINTGSMRVHLSNGNGFDIQTWSASLYSSHDWNYLGDFNGDGKTDILGYRNGSSMRMNFSTGSGFDNQVWSTAHYGSPSWNYMGDFNGDGKTDMLSYINGSSMRVHFSDGKKFDIQTWSSQHNGNWYWNYFGDFNGDGKTDMASYRNGSSMNVHLSTGSAFEIQTWSSQHNGNWYWNYLGDFNGDGKTDIASYYNSSSIRVHLSEGTKFDVQYQTAYLYGNQDWNYFDDFNGDGKIDIVSYINGSSMRVHFPSYLPDLISNLSNGLGGTTTVDFTPSSAWTNTYLPLRFVLQTVSSLTTSDGRGGSSTTNYSFEGGLWSNTERRFLGFRKVTAVLDAAGNYTETYYHQHVGCIAKPETTYFRDAQGNIYSYSSYHYQENTSPPYTSLLTERWDYEYNLDDTRRRVVSQIAYDQYGNATATHEYGDYDLTGDERTTVRGYVPNTEKYVVTRPAYENIYAGIGTNGALAEQTLFLYDGNMNYQTAPVIGDLTEKKGWNNETGGYSSTRYWYDALGNLVWEEDALGFARTTNYDSIHHLYVISKCDELGQCSQNEWDTVLGVLVSQTDANGSKTTYTRDPLGRLLRKSYPDGTWREYSYLDWGNPNRQRVREILWDGIGNGLWTEVYQDGLGRVYKEVKEAGFVQETVYQDSSSRVWKKSDWYGPGETPRYKVFAYDGAFRLRTATNPDGTYGEMIYGDGFVAHYDELGHEKVVFKDGLGRTIEILEKNWDETYKTSYQYDALGHLVRVKDALGNESTFAWDSLGRKVAMCDADAGCWTYKYDAVGQLVSHTAANGQTVTYDYDAIGRMTSKTGPDGPLATWVYDEPGHGASIGQATTIKDRVGTEGLSYDAAGNITSRTKCVQGLCYTLGFTYDGLGRVRSVTYPDGEVVTYDYDTQGRLASVSGYADSFAYNARGKLLTAAYANGTITTFSYDPNRQWLKDALVKRGSETLYQASYTYDAAARVTAIESSTNPLFNMRYSYDELNRLTAVKGAQNQFFAYDEIGNITYNSEVGTYAYDDPAHVHAVTQAGDTSYAYDANGNLVSVDGSQVGKAAPAGSAYFFGGLLEHRNGELIKYYFAGPMLVARQDGSGVRWYHQDHLGSVKLITDESGQEVARYGYTPFGAQIAASGVDDEQGFAGHQKEGETGIIYMNARYYDPRLGRFLSADTIVPDPANPQALNRYAYVYNNPISNIDPSGNAPVVAAVVTVASVAASSAPAWVMGIAVAGAATSIVGYATKDPTLSTIGGVMLGFSGGYASGAGFFKAGWAGGVATATVAAATSPVSPLNPKIKQAVGWAFTAQGIIKGLYDSLKAVDVKGLPDGICRDGSGKCLETLTPGEQASFEGGLGSYIERGEWISDGAVSKASGYYESALHQKWAEAFVHVTGNKLTAEQAMMYFPWGGRTGPGGLSLPFKSGVLYRHAIVHDLYGILRQEFDVGPGYGGFFPSSPLSGHLVGIVREIMAPTPLVSVAPGSSQYPLLGPLMSAPIFK
jgi:RHS repeat-associated protein